MAELYRTRVQNLTADFAAIIADGLQLVERDRVRVVLDGQTLRGDQAQRPIWVCGPASFTVLKARAIDLREKPKDAFDLHYVLCYYPDGVDSVAAALRPLMNDRDAVAAVECLIRNYRTIDDVGPTRAAFFLYGDSTDSNVDNIDELKASAHAYVLRLLSQL